MAAPSASPVDQVGLGFCYAMNRMDFHLASDPRELALRDDALACARRVA